MMTTTDRRAQPVRTCRRCHTARVLWTVTTPGGKPMPVDVRASDRGNVQITRDPSGIYATVLGHREAAAARGRGQQLHLAHFVTCAAGR